MSKTVDERVVEMRFDNRQFEQNVATTMSTLDKLKQKLNFRGAGKGLEEIGTAAQKVDMRGLGSGVEAVSAKFSALQVVGVTALANITNSAVNAGKRIVSALTIDPVKTGFQEYETQMNSVQTILANTQSKGSTLKDVNAALDELNKYADLTIYNFTEMTRNIGTFTAAGIDLKTSVSAIQGIANLAAVSGSTSQQASTAMYQLSQALASGTVKLMDWNSVVNAGMGGEIFQNALKKTSELLGTGAEAAIKAKGSFRESLTTGWLTAEVLTETLKKFTTSGANEYVAEYTGLSVDAIQAALDSAKAQYGEADAITYAAKALANKSGKSEKEIKQSLEMARTAEDAATKVKTFTQLWDVMKEAAQSGWAQTWRLIIGDFEEAKNLLTPLSKFFTDMIERMSSARNALIGGALGKGFGELAKRFDNLLVPAKKAADIVTKVTKSVEDLDTIVNKVIRGEYGNADTGRFEKLAEEGYNYCIVQNKVNEALGNSFRYTKEQIDAQDKLLGVQKESSEATSGEAESTSTLTEEKKKLLKQIASMSEEQMKANGYTEDQIEAFKELKSTAEKLGIPINEFIDNMDKINGRWLLINSFKNIGKALVDIFNSIAEAWKAIFPTTLEERIERLFNALGGLHKITASFRNYIADNVDEITRTFKGLFAALDIILTVVGGPIKIAFKILTEILGMFNLNILDVTAVIGDAIVNFRGWIDSVLDFEGLFNKIIPYLSKISEKIKEVFNSIKNTTIFDKLINTFSKLISLFKKLFKFDVGSIDFRNVVSKIRETLSSIPGEMVEIGRNIMKAIRYGVGDEASVIFGKIKEVGLKIIETIKGILGIHSPSTVMYEIGTNIVKGLVNGIKAGIQFIVDGIANIGHTIITIFKGVDFSGIAEPLSNGLNTLKETLGKFDWKKLLAIIPVGVTLVVVKQMYDFTKALTNGINSINGVINGLVGIEASFSKILKAYATNIKADALKKIAISIAILVGAVIALTFIEPKKLLTAVAVIGVLSGILVGLAFAMNKMNSASATINKNGIQLGGLKASLIAMASSLLLLAATVKIIGNMDPEKAKQGFMGLAGLVLALAGVFVAYGLLVKGNRAQNIDKAGKMLIKMSASLLLMVVAIKLISRLKGEELLKGGLVIAGFVGVVALLSSITNLSGNGIDKLGGMMIKLSTALLLMTVAIKLISKLKGEDLLKGGIAIAGFVGIVALLSLITRIGKGAIEKLGSTLMAMSASMLIMVFVIKLISGLSPEDVVKGGLAVLAFTGIIALLIKAVKMAGPGAPKIAGTLVAISIAIGILAGAAILLSMMSIEGLAKGITAVSMLGLVISAMIAATRGARNCKRNLIVMVVAIGIMVGAIALLSLIDGSKLAGATASLSVLMGMFALIAKSAGTMSKATGSLIIITVAVGLLAGILYLLSGLPIESSLGNAAALSILLISMSAALRILSSTSSTAIKSVGALALMGLIIGEMAVILGLMARFNVTPSIETAAALSTLLLAMSGALSILTKVGIFGMAAFAGIGALATLIAGIGGLIVGIGYLVTKFPVLEEFLNTGIPIIEKIGYAIGSFFGNIVSGLATGAMSCLPEIATYLSDFMVNVQPFIDGAGKIDSSVLSGVGILSGAIIALTAADLIAGIASLIQGGATFSELGKDLSDFMENASGFIESASSLDADMLSGVKTLAEAILILTRANVINGIAAWVAGGSSLSSFSEQLPELGTNLNSFVTNLGTFTTDQVETIKCAGNAIKALAEAADTIPNEGGWAAKIFGDNSISTFGEYLPALGTNLNQFATNLGTFTDEQANTVTCAANAIRAMAKAAESIPNEGGWAAAILGDNSLATFGSKLPELGTNLSSFAVNLGTFSDEQVNTVTCAANAIKAMAEAADAIPNEGGWAAAILGDNSIATFGSKLPTLGENLSSFAGNLGTFAPDQVETVKCAANAIKAMAEAATSINGQPDWAAKIFGDNSIATFGSKLPTLGTNLSSFVANLGVFTEDQVSTVRSAVSSIRAFATLADADLKGANGQLSAFGDNIIEFGSDISTFVGNLPGGDAISDAITNAKKILSMVNEFADANSGTVTDFTKSLKELGNDGVDAFVKAFTSESAKTDVMQAGKDLIDKIREGVTSKKSDLKKDFEDIASAGADAAKGKKDDFKTAGKNVVIGFANGITENKFEAEAAAKAMAEAALEAAREALREASPSKAFYEVGDYGGQGFVNALWDYENKSYNAGEGIAESAKNGLSGAIRKIRDMIEFGGDAQPTIRPVLDLSDVESGVGDIGKLLNMRSSVGVQANVGAISTMMSGRSQNGTNADVISAIDKLRKGLENAGTTSYNINGITYDDGSNVAEAIQTLIRAAKIERRV